jgi:thiol:disulfide interchange protein
MILIAAGVALMVGVGARAQIISMPNRDIYPPIKAAHGDIKAALVEARHTHKRVILEFGGDWCGDCKVLNIYLHQSPNVELLDKYFILVHVNSGHEDANLDLARKYGIPPTGVPRLVVIDGQDRVVYAQTNRYDDLTNVQPGAVTEFLNKWKP